MNELINEILKDPISSLMIIGNLVLIESLLSIDNAVVLATMVLALPHNQRKRALNYGIVGAYLFRGICLLLATYLIKIWWLKVIGGAYLLYLLFEWFKKKSAKKKGHVVHKKSENGLYSIFSGKIGHFWATVISVELMDLAFSMDNVFAAVAFSNNILIILCGVFIGILAMRFVAQAFVKLMELYPFLDTCAYMVIGILGFKLVLTLYTHYFPDTEATHILHSHMADWVTSGLTLGIFVIPIITSLAFNFPARKKSKQSKAE